MTLSSNPLQSIAGFAMESGVDGEEKANADTSSHQF